MGRVRAAVPDGGAVAARGDVKSDRERGRLLVGGAFMEEGEEAGPVAEALAAELRTMAEWLGFETVAVGRREPRAGAGGKF